MSFEKMLSISPVGFAPVLRTSTWIHRIDSASFSASISFLDHDHIFAIPELAFCREITPSTGNSMFTNLSPRSYMRVRTVTRDNILMDGYYLADRVPAYLGCTTFLTRQDRWLQNICRQPGQLNTLRAHR